MAGLSVSVNVSKYLSVSLWVIEVSDDPDLIPGTNLLRAMWNTANDERNRQAVIFLICLGVVVWFIAWHYKFDSLQSFLAIALISIFFGLRETRREVKEEGRKTRDEIEKIKVMLEKS